MVTIEKTFDMMYRAHATKEDAELFDRYNEIGEQVSKITDAIERECGDEISAKLHDMCGVLKCRQKTFLGNTWGYFYVSNELEDPNKEYCVKYEYDPNSNALIKVILYEEDWQERTFENTLSAHKWGFELLHHFDVNIEVRKIIEKYVNKIRMYNDMLNNVSIAQTDIIIKYEK